MSVKVGFKAKYGYNEIELPFNVGEKVYLDNAPTGLSDLSSGTFYTDKSDTEITINCDKSKMGKAYS